MQVLVLPEDPVVLLVDADRILDRRRCAVLVGEHRVEVTNLAEAVTPEGQRVGEAAETPLTGVERVLPSVQQTGIAVRHDHLAHGRTVHYRPDTTAVFVADGVKHEPFVRIHRHPQRPPLPRDRVSVDGEARTLALHDVERAEPGARRPVVVQEVRTLVRGNGDDPVVLYLQHLACRHVDEHEHTLDRPRVAVVARIVPQVRQHASDATVGLVRHTEPSGGPRVELHLREVVDAARAHGVLPLFVLHHGGDGVQRLLEKQRRTHVVYVDATGHRLVREGHHGFHEVGSGAGHDRDRGSTLDAAPRELVLRGLVEHHSGDEHRLLDVIFLGSQDLDGPRDLVRRQRFERVDRHAGRPPRTTANCRSGSSQLRLLSGGPDDGSPTSVSAPAGAYWRMYAL